MRYKVEDMREAIQDIIKASRGDKGHYTIISRTAQDSAERNGYIIKPNFNELHDEEFIQQLIQQGYKFIKLYYVTTYIRGYYKTVAKVKR